MLTKLDDRKVETFGVQQSNNFTIKANGKAFKTLIDGLYSDKIRAVIRELWTNAFDSHVMAGCKDKPFDCQLPGRFDPSFRVRDYGVSLSHEDVMHLYTTVFESTKEDTNDQVGKLGLGSKSPFAYTDTFTVTAWKDGKKRVYSAFIGDKYVPQIAFMGEEDTDEPTGLEVAFPCKPEDVESFKAAARKVIRGFDVVPNILGVELQIGPLETILQSKDGITWRMVRYDSFLGNQAHARQGCVIYPLDVHAIRDLSPEGRAVLQCPILIDFPIGQLEISASRESLSYDEATRDNIVAMANSIADEIAEAYSGKIKNAATYWEACKAYADIMSGIGGNQQARTILSIRSIYWRGRKVTQSIDLTEFLTSNRTNLGVTSGGIAATHVSHYKRSRRVAPKWEQSAYIKVDVRDTVILFEDIRESLSLPGIRLKHATLNGRNGISSGDVLWVKGDPTSMNAKRLMALLGKPPVTTFDVATFPLPPKAPKGQSTKKPVPMRVWNSREWDEITINANDPHIYVKLDRREVVDHKGSRIGRTGGVGSVLRSLIAVGALPKDVQIIGVPNTHKDKVGDNWQCLWDVAREFVDANYDADKVSRAEAYSRYMHDSGCIARKFVREMIGDRKTATFKHTGPAKDFAEFYAAAKADAATLSTFSEIRSLRDQLDMARDHKPHGDIDDSVLSKAFKDAYPLVVEVMEAIGYGWGGNQKLTKGLVEYVNLIDKNKAKSQSVTKNDEIAVAA